MESCLRRTGSLLRTLALALVFTTGLTGCGETVPPAERILLVTIDTLRADRVGAYGDDSAHTPTMDLLASQGVRFEHAISPAPVTLPAHASLMTALDPPEHGVRSNGIFVLDEQIPTVAEHMKRAGFATAAFVAAFVLESRFGLARGFDVYGDDVGHKKASDGAFAVPERRGDRVVDEALQWINQAPERFFLWVHMYDPHADYRPPAKWKTIAGGDNYAGEVAFSDHQVGRLVEGIRRRFGMEGLVVTVTSDHGEAMGEHGELTHTYGIYDTTQRVPLIMMGQGLPVGRTVRKPARLIDIAPTLLSLADAEPLAEVRGQDLLPLIYGEDEEPRVAYVETLDTQIGMGWSPLLGLRTHRYKYIRSPRPELYDIQADPSELDDLASLSPEIVSELDAELSARLAGSSAIKNLQEISEEDRAQLMALGYIVSESDDIFDNLGVVGGPNPIDFIEDGTILNLVGGRIGRREYPEALAMTERVRSRGERYYRFRGIAAAMAGEAEIAREAATALLERNAERADGYWILASAALVDGDSVEAKKQFEAALTVNPRHVPSILALGRLSESQEDLDQAVIHYERAAELGKNTPEPLLHLAELRLRQGNFDEADALLERTRDALATLEGTSIRVAATERAAGRTDRALAILEAARKENPAYAPVQRQQAQYLEEDGRYAEARTTRQRILSLDSSDPTSQNDLAWSLAIEGTQLDRALRLALSATRAMGDDPAALDTLSSVHLARGELDDALATATRALETAPEALRPHLHYVQAAALSGLGREAEARAAIRKAAAPADGPATHWKPRAVALAGKLGVSL